MSTSGFSCMLQVSLSALERLTDLIFSELNYHFK